MWIVGSNNVTKIRERMRCNLISSMGEETWLIWYNLGYFEVDLADLGLI